MKKTNVLFAALSVLTLSLSAVPAFAAGGACRADREKFCSGIEKGGGRIHACLQEHESELSSDCRHQLKEMEKRKAERQEAHRACRDDHQKYCGDVKPGEGRIKACLREHHDELSKDCRKALDS